MVNQTEKQAGEAYAFFNCRASKDEIEREIVDIRRDIGTPNQLELELSLTEGIDPKSLKDGNFWEHSGLMRIAQDAKNAGIRYSMSTRYENATNRQTADELAGILNQAYQSPLYQKKEEFRGRIFFEEKGHYIDRE